MTPHARTGIWRLLLVASAMLLLLAACSTSASIELSDSAVAGSDDDSSTSSNSVDDGPNAGNTDNALPVPSEDEPDDDSAEAGTNESPAEGDSDESAASTGDDGPLFELQGDLALDTQEVNSLIEFIQEETGRDFLRPPVIVAQSAELFAEGLAEDFDDFAEGAEESARFLQSLGLTELGPDEMVAAFVAILSDPELGVAGYYDPETEELYVPTGVLGDGDFQALLVHELTHSLDGQHANLNNFEEMSDAAEASGNYEPLIAFQAVVEGRATSVQNRWLEATGTPAPADGDPDTVGDVPPSLLISLSIPYAFGEIFINANGGPGNTWDLLENPPLTSEEFIAAGTGIGVEPVIDVPTPAADGPIIDESVFGAADVFTWLLGESLDPDPRLLFPTFNAIDGWAGGRAVTWGDEFESCTRIALAADSPSDLDEIEDAIGIWADDAPDRTVERDGDLVVATGCAPFIP